MQETRLKSTLHARAIVALLFAVPAVSSCGGHDGPSGPGPVASVQLTLPSATIQVGALLSATVHYFDVAHAELTGLTVTYTTSNELVATVDARGVVIGVAPGSATISATVGGARGSAGVSVLPVPIASIRISPATPTVRQTGTIALSAQPLDSTGHPLSGRTVSWTSADPARATVGPTGIAAGIAQGNVFIRAESEGRRDSVSLHVRGLNAPDIVNASTGTLVPGGSGSITGTNFGATPSANVLLVNGVVAAITSASPTAITFTVPPVTALPCTPTGPALVQVVANQDTGSTTMNLQMTTPRSLGVGESLLLTSQADVRCNEFAVTGGRYLITTFNYATNAGVKTSFQLLGSSVTAASVQPALPAIAAPEPRSRAMGPMTPAQRFERGHLAQLDMERDFARTLGARLPAAHAKNVQRDVAQNPPPAVGSMVTYHMRRTFTNFNTWDAVRFRVVYVGPKVIILEDSASALAGTMDNAYRKIGQEFDQVMYPLLLDFGDPLVDDAALDNNGRLIAMFSPRVNNYVVNGTPNGIAGFVTLCDFLDTATCPSSNVAEAFYAIVPDPNDGLDLETWQRIMRGTFIHEVKHIVSYAWRIYLNSSLLEETWLEESTAQVAAELWARTIYNKGQGTDIAFDDGPRCDYAPVSATCPDPAEAILNHFGYLYDHYNALESKSILDDPLGGTDLVIYGSSWSFVRWVTDLYGTTEANFLGSLVQVVDDHGTANISARAGHPFSELLGLWSLASLADNYPGAQVLDPHLRLPSWNSRDILAGMSQHVFYSDGSPAFPRAWPMNERFVSFGTFTGAEKTVLSLPGGGFAAWELSGTQLSPQVLAIRAVNGGQPPTTIGMAIVRIQ